MITFCRNVFSRAAKSDFIWLNVLLLIINIPMFFDIVLPLYDSMSYYQSFHAIYNELVVRGTLPLWMPYNSFGLESNAYFLYCSPFALFTIALGSLFKIKNVYLMFKLSMYLEQILFLFGTYILSKRLFSRRATIIAVSVIMVGYPSLMHYIESELYVVSHMPLVIYLIVRYFDTYRLRFLVLAMLLVNIFLLGVFYLASLYALECLTIFICLFIPRLRHWKSLLRIGARELAVSAMLIALMVAFSGSIYFVLSDARKDSVIMSPGRLESGEIIKEYNEEISGIGGLQPIRQYIDPNINRDVDFSIHVIYYIGFVPFLFILYGLVYNRNALSVAFLLNIVVLVWMSLGTRYVDVNGQQVLYLNNIRVMLYSFLYDHFPFMKFYRDTPYAWRSVTMFLVLLSGFGMDGAFKAIEGPGEAEA